jgi:hypothetical protein
MVLIVIAIVAKSIVNCYCAVQLLFYCLLSMTLPIAYAWNYTKSSIRACQTLNQKLLPQSVHQHGQ